MATIIFKCLDTPSHYNATYKLADELKKRGHRIIYIGHPSFSDTIIRQSFEFYNHSIFPAGQRFSKGNIFEKMVFDYKVFKQNEEYYLKGLPLEDVIKKLKPDLFILDVSLNFLFPILLENQIKFIIYNTKVNLDKAHLVPPVTSSFIPKNSLWSGILVELLWQYRFLEKRLFVIQDNLKCFGKSNTLLIRKYLKSRNIDRKNIIDTNRVGHFGIKLAPEIILSLQEFDFGTKIKDNQLYMCPCVNLFRNKWTKEFDLSETLERANIKGSFDKLVYCSFGSYDSKFRLTRIKFFVRLINIFLKKENYLLIISTGKDINPRWFKLEASNIHLSQTVPQLEILSNCDLMINQGGMQSIQECILKQVPMLVYPLNPGLDQEGNAARVLYHGLGLKGNIRRDKDEEIERKIETVLSEKNFKEQIIHFRKRCLENDSFERGLQFIDSYINSDNSSFRRQQLSGTADETFKKRQMDVRFSTAGLLYLLQAIYDFLKIFQINGHN